MGPHQRVDGAGASRHAAGMNRAVLRVLALLIAVGGASLAAAQVLDPDSPVTVVVGTPGGHAPSFRVDAARTGRAHAELPKAPQKLWGHDLAGGLDVPPLVDGAGAIVAALAGSEVVWLDVETGWQSWRARLGGSAAVVPPV